MIKNDHKSLEQISRKNLVDAPVCLQRLLLQLQDYDFTIKYCPGAGNGCSRHLDISVNHVYIDAEKKQDYQLA